MSWQNEIVRMVRYLVDDYVEPLTYTDERLEELCVIGAQFVVLNLDFDKDYSVDVDCITITPDPTDATRDNAFINLVALKAACILLSAESKAKAGCAMSVKDGPSTIDMRETYKALQEKAKEACSNFEMAKLEYQAGNARAGEAIMTPYTADRVIPYPGNFN